MRLFGPSQGDIWMKLSDDIGAEFIASGQIFKTYTVIKKFRQWNIILDKECGTRENSTVYTRLRAKFKNKHGFRLKIFGEYHQGYFDDFFDMQDIDINYDSFDKNFTVRSNCQIAVKKFFENERIRNQISSQSEIFFEIRDINSYEQGFEEISEDDNILCLKIPGVIKDNEMLKELFELLGESLLEVEKINNEYGHLDINNFTKFDVVKSSMKNAVKNKIPFEKIRVSAYNNIKTFTNREKKEQDLELKVETVVNKEKSNSKEESVNKEQQKDNNYKVMEKVKHTNVYDEKSQVTIEDLSINVKDLNIDTNDLNISIDDLKMNNVEDISMESSEIKEKIDYKDKGEHVDF